MLLGPPKVMRAAPLPPSASSLPAHSPSLANNNSSATSVTLNPDTVMKFTNMMNQNESTTSTSQLPPLPPRDVPPTNPGGTVRRPPPPSPLADFVDNVPAERLHDQSNTAALDYDHEFESRFRFTPIENLPPPEAWKPPPVPQPIEAK